MSKQFNSFLLKIFILSTFIVLVFNIGDNLLNATSNKNINKNIDNNIAFKKVNNSSIGKTGVALATNIGIKYKEKTNLPSTIYKDIFSINEIRKNQSGANDKIIGLNMSFIEEYKNVLKTDVKQLLDSSYDRSRFLNAYIDQLEFRYVLNTKNMNHLIEQKRVFENNISKVNQKIDVLKVKIELDFKNNNAKNTLENIDNYLKLKEDFNYSKTYIIYINHFLNEYNSLNNYNKLLIDTLINNKDALIKNSFIVIPDSGNQLLKKFNLIYDENEIKK